MRTANSPLIRGVVILALALAPAACGGPLTYAPHGQGGALAANFDIKANIDRDHSNTGLDIQVVSLPEPALFGPGNNFFVVWHRHDAARPWTKLGTLAYNPSSRDGNFAGSAPETDFDLMITVEPDSSPGSPSQTVVVQQRVGNPEEGHGSQAVQNTPAPKRTRHW